MFWEKIKIGNKTPTWFRGWSAFPVAVVREQSCDESRTPGLLIIMNFLFLIWSLDQAWRGSAQKYTPVISDFTTFCVIKLGSTTR